MFQLRTVAYLCKEKDAKICVVRQRLRVFRHSEQNAGESLWMSGCVRQPFIEPTKTETALAPNGSTTQLQDATAWSS